MPQMAPYNWLMMFFMFNFILSFYSSYINFIHIPNLMKKINFKKNYYNWKW